MYDTKQIEKTAQADFCLGYLSWFSLFLESCSYITDLCDDADAIGITRLLRTKRPSTHILSETMIKYYSNLTKKERYMQYQNDGLDYSDLNTLSNSIYKK